MKLGQLNKFLDPQNRYLDHRAIILNDLSPNEWECVYQSDLF